jgi:hypothetical protein
MHESERSDEIPGKIKLPAIDRNHPHHCYIGPRLPFTGMIGITPWIG